MKMLINGFNSCFNNMLSCDYEMRRLSMSTSPIGGLTMTEVDFDDIGGKWFGQSIGRRFLSLVWTGNDME